MEASTPAATTGRPAAAERRLMARFTVLAVVSAVVVFGLDVYTKRLVIANLAVGELVEIVPGWLVFTHVQNTGAAYGILAGQGWLLLPLSIAAAVLVPLVLWRTGIWRARPLLGGLAAGLIFGGALGNLLERLQVGAVTDFIQVVPIPLFQVFNVSDAAICVGAVALLLVGQSQPAPPATPE